MSMMTRTPSRSAPGRSCLKYLRTACRRISGSATGCRFCSSASSLIWRNLTSHVRSSSASAPRLPTRAGRHEDVRSAVRSPRFRCGPFVRDGVFYLGRASAPRVTTPHMLPSATLKASASAILLLSRLNSPPVRVLCTLRRGRRLPQRNTRYQADATPYLGRTCTGWIAPASWRTKAPVRFG